jgi:transcriptional repressor NrdR
MICPKCGNDKTSVVGTVADISVERYRKCSKCGYSFLTKEKVMVDESLVDYKKLQDGIGNNAKK